MPFFPTTQPICASTKWTPQTSRKIPDCSQVTVNGRSRGGSANATATGRPSLIAADNAKKNSRQMLSLDLTELPPASRADPLLIRHSPDDCGARTHWDHFSWM